MSINGVCLTAVAVDGGRLRVRRSSRDARPHVARQTLEPGSRVNLEPALRAGEPLGGHYVQGHVDGVGEGPRGRAGGRRPADLVRRAPELLRYVVEKGSIAVEGTSLTVAALDDGGFAVALIPHTLEATTLGALEPGDPVNLEADVLAKYVERLLGGQLACRAWPSRRPFATIEDAIEEIREGRIVVVVDDPDRENEGDLVIAAQFATPEAINFMATHARGLICLCLTEERADALGLRPMTEHNEAPLGTAFTVTVEAREGVTTGISAADRSHTIQVAIAPTRRRTTSSRRATSSRCAPGRAACSSGSARPRPPSTSRASPG